VTFTAAASGAPAPTVQWQTSTNGGQTWADIPGAGTGALQVTATAGRNGAQFRAVFTNVAGTATTNAATLFVSESFIGFKTPGKRARINSGSTLPVAFMLPISPAAR